MRKGRCAGTTEAMPQQDARSKDAKAADPALAAALRANLLKRKQQVKQRSGGVSEASANERSQLPPQPNKE